MIDGLWFCYIVCVKEFPLLPPAQWDEFIKIYEIVQQIKEKQIGQYTKLGYLCLSNTGSPTLVHTCPFTFYTDMCKCNWLWYTLLSSEKLIDC